MGVFDTGPLRARIRAGEFEAVVTTSALGHYRTLASVPPDISAEIARDYVPFCSAGREFVIHLPRNQRQSSSLGSRLKQLGCVPRDTTALLPR
jgi:hypothetical protein